MLGICYENVRKMLGIYSGGSRIVVGGPGGPGRRARAAGTHQAAPNLTDARNCRKPVEAQNYVNCLRVDKEGCLRGRGEGGFQPSLSNQACVNRMARVFVSGCGRGGGASEPDLKQPIRVNKVLVEFTAWIQKGEGGAPSRTLSNPTS